MSSMDLECHGHLKNFLNQIAFNYLKLSVSVNVRKMHLCWLHTLKGLSLIHI